METIRIMPCLDMRNARVVKGVHFVDLRDAGDPVENAVFSTKRRGPTNWPCLILLLPLKTDKKSLLG